VRESRTPGSARGAGGNSRPYHDRIIACLSNQVDWSGEEELMRIQMRCNDK
jgi:hypothetical protein